MSLPPKLPAMSGAVAVRLRAAAISAPLVTTPLCAAIVAWSARRGASERSDGGGGEAVKGDCGGAREGAMKMLPLRFTFTFIRDGDDCDGEAAAKGDRGAGASGCIFTTSAGGAHCGGSNLGDAAAKGEEVGVGARIGFSGRPSGRMSTDPLRLTLTMAGEALEYIEGLRAQSLTPGGHVS